MTAEFQIPSDHPALPGHFPGDPIVPGVLLLQRVLEHIRIGFGLEAPLTLHEARFHRPLRPGQLCTLELRHGGGHTVSFAIRIGNEPLARGTFRDAFQRV